MTDPAEGKRSTTSPTHANTDPQLDSLRSILLEEERRRLYRLEQETEALLEATDAQSEDFAKRLSALQAKIEALQEENQRQRAQSDALQAELEALQQQVQTDSKSLVPRLIQQMGFIITNTVNDKRDELAEALGPIMGDAIRVQIRDSRKEMVETLYPIILETVMRAVSEFLREFQRNIDARLRKTFNFKGFLKRAGARLRGVSAAELALRESFGFSIEELFLIQHESGLLLAHHGLTSEASDDSDLIGGMLTAIRDFAVDSFGDGDDEQELREIEFGDERIIIQSGQYIYAAAVIKGIEPSGFHGQLREFLSELHINHKPELRDYVGDPATLPDLPAALADFSQRAAVPEQAESAGMTRNQRWLIAGGAGVVLLFTAVACFYLQFTIALWPLAFGATATPTLTATPTHTATVTHTATPEPTVVPLPTETAVPPTAVFSPTAAATESAILPTNTLPPAATATAEPSSTPSPQPAPVTVRSVWLRAEPDMAAPVTVALPANTAVTILTRSDDWVEVAWQDESGPQQGWLGLRWLAVDGLPLSAVATPTRDS